ncbi:beta-N-acetylhexosaminidase [Bacillus sp. APMAM]|nr:beta-N-acetylhexosaminidase [Bacillus sp. APMAM]RTZ56568.1 beta-N-acetylhexosaminidase [Bacillus sp. SAJ1]
MKTYLTKILVIVSTLFLITGCGMKNEKPIKNNADPVQEELNRLSLSEKIGQMIIGGFEGTSVTTDAADLIKEYKLGGLILFGTNIKSETQLVNLTNALKTANSNNKVPLFISTDQEGGRVNRMPASIINTPRARSIGETNNEKYAYNIGNVIANELTSFGFNVDFAPVLDIQSNPKNTVIGDRSFGSNSNIVSKQGAAMMKGIRSGNIIPVVKHFPGHGDTSVDSHLALPVVNKDLASLNNLELIPFRNAFKNKADMVMVAHILMKKLDSKYPASMSKTVITGLLRKQLGFEGVVITDDMTMGAIAKHYNLKDAAVKAVNAGSDMILVGHGKENVSTVYNSLYKAAKNHTISKSTINKSVYRILSLKRKYKLTNNTVSPVNITKLNARIKKAISTGSSTTGSTKNILLHDIASKAKKGEIINAEFHLGSTIDAVRKEWGEEEKRDYVAAAKGTYSTYSKKHVVVAYNIEQLLFEIRSFDPKLKNLTLIDIKNYFGSPISDVTTENNEEILSYSHGAYTLKFVFSTNSQNTELDHYSVYSPPK